MSAVNHRSAKLNGIKLHWVTADSGPPVYILHGFPETWFGGRKQIGFLADSFTVVAPEPRGYCASGKPVSGAPADYHDHPPGTGTRCGPDRPVRPAVEAGS